MNKIKYSDDKCFDNTMSTRHSVADLNKILGVTHLYMYIKNKNLKFNYEPGEVIL